MSPRPYFAYGSNIRPEQMLDRCPDAELLGPAALEGYAFQINARGVATLIPATGRSAFGVLWTVSNEDLVSLDRHEGVSKGLYYREAIIVRRWPAGPAVEAITYLATDVDSGEARPGYVDEILEAASRFGFPPEALREIERWS